jgi:hypothetical protein
MADRFDVMPVGIENERTIVASVISRPEARLAVIVTSGSQCCCVEAIDGRPIRGSKSYVDPDDWSGFETDPKERLPLDSVSSECLTFCIEALNTDRIQGLIIEGLGPFDITDANRYVVKHHDLPRQILHAFGGTLTNEGAQCWPGQSLDRR